MLNCFFTDSAQTAIPIVVLTPLIFPVWLDKQTSVTKAWLETTGFQAEGGATSFVPDAMGKLERVICCVRDQADRFALGHLPMLLPPGRYQFDDVGDHFHAYAIAWGLGAYQFTRYKKPIRQPAQIYLPHSQSQSVLNCVESLYLVRDWINTPTDDMGPTQFADVCVKLANEYAATCHQIIGEELLAQNYAAIYTVGRASDDPPRLLDLRWGDASHPKVTLVGKGVCFDSGGLDIKPSVHMLLMKKDMAGGAHVLGLARMIMAAKLPIRLRVLIPVVENVISGNAYRPGDIIKSRKGLTIEVGNTDAEGRVILADALTEAVNEHPDLLIDITTLTGAARVALGTELPAVFSNHEETVTELMRHAEIEQDRMWRLPLFALYREYLNSSIADINNNSTEPYAGAITAALFLKEFVPDDIPWVHFDMMAWNLRARPGKPIGGEAFALRALFSYLKQKYTA